MYCAFSWCVSPTARLKQRRKILSIERTVRFTNQRTSHTISYIFESTENHFTRRSVDWANVKQFFSFDIWMWSQVKRMKTDVSICVCDNCTFWNFRSLVGRSQSPKKRKQISCCAKCGFQSDSIYPICQLRFRFLFIFSTFVCSFYICTVVLFAFADQCVLLTFDKIDWWLLLFNESKSKRRNIKVLTMKKTNLMKPSRHETSPNIRHISSENIYRWFLISVLYGRGVFEFVRHVHCKTKTAVSRCLR